MDTTYGYGVLSNGSEQWTQLADWTTRVDARDDNTTTIPAIRIPDLDAGKITSGEFDAARIPDLSATKITSDEFDAARIPNLDAGKITTGTIDPARLPNLTHGTAREYTDIAARNAAVEAWQPGDIAFIPAATASDHAEVYIYVGPALTTPAATTNAVWRLFSSSAGSLTTADIRAFARSATTDVLAASGLIDTINDNTDTNTSINADQIDTEIARSDQIALSVANAGVVSVNDSVAGQGDAAKQTTLQTAIGGTAVGRSVFTAADAAAARTAIGAGTGDSSFSGAYSDLTGAPVLATVATTGSFADLTNRPTIFIPWSTVGLDSGSARGSSTVNATNPTRILGLINLNAPPGTVTQTIIFGGIAARTTQHHYGSPPPWSIDLATGAWRPTNTADRTAGLYEIKVSGTAGAGAGRLAIIFNTATATGAPTISQTQYPIFTDGRDADFVDIPANSRGNLTTTTRLFGSNAADFTSFTLLWNDGAINAGVTDVKLTITRLQ